LIGRLYWIKALNQEVFIMSKVKKSESSHYELLYIIPNKFTDEEAAAIDEKIKKSIAAAKGEVTYSEDWGKKKLAYPIKGYNHGYYKLVEFDLLAAELSKLDNSMRLSNDVLRHQIIKAKKRSSEEIEKDKKISEELFKLRRSGTEPEVAAKPAEEVVKQEVVAKAEEEAVEEPKAGAKKKTDLKDLDKKLDDILDAGDLI
jgi:small subunit ribosomal protein S6